MTPISLLTPMTPMPLLLTTTAPFDLAVLAAGVVQVALLGAVVVLAVLLLIVIATDRRRARREHRDEPGVGLIERDDHSVREATASHHEMLSGAETAVDLGGAAFNEMAGGEATAADVEKLIASIEAITGASRLTPAVTAAATTPATDGDSESTNGANGSSGNGNGQAAVAVVTSAATTAKAEESAGTRAADLSLPAASTVAFADDETATAPATRPAVTEGAGGDDQHGDGDDDRPEDHEDDGQKYDLLLTARVADAGDRLDVIRLIRELAGVGLFEAMTITDTPATGEPGVVLAGATKGAVNRARRRLERANAALTVEPAKDRTPAPVAAPPASEAETAVTAEQLQELAAQARAMPGGKKRKTFAEYEEDRRRELERRTVEKAERRAAYKARLEKEVFFVGRGVSAPLYLKKHTFDGEKLGLHGLPKLGSAEDVAAAIGITPRELRWLCYHREDAVTEHYHRFTIPKRSGGTREISSPKPLLRKAQAWVLANVLAKIATHDAAHGFIPGRSTTTNAAPHQRAAAILKLDVVDFFPSITFPRVKGLLQKSLGFGEAAATVMALVCTEPPRVTAEYDGDRFRVAVGARQLPQGACTSPAITNILCRRLDSRLAGLAAKYGWQYTRYADDVTFSGPTGDRAIVGQIMGGAIRILGDEGFTVHRDKIGVFRAGRQQRVTGIVVNDKLSLDRRAVRAFRALLHDTLANGPEKANRGRWANFFGYLQGYSAYLHMVDPEKAKPYREQVEQIRQKYFA